MVRDMYISLGVGIVSPLCYLLIELCTSSLLVVKKN